VPSCGGLCRPDLAPLDLDYSTGVDACASYTCGAAYPAACLTLPVWHLVVEDSNLALLTDNRDRDLEVPARLLAQDQCRAVRLELHGGLARTFEKKSFQVKLLGGGLPFDPFADDLGGSQPPSLPLENLILKAQWVDPSLVRDALTHELVRAAGGLAPRVRFVHLVLARRYHGLYALTEAVDGRFLDAAGLPPAGQLYKAVNHNANFQPKEQALAGYEKKLGTEGSDGALETLLTALWACPSGDKTCFDTRVLPRLDLDSYFAYLAANALADNRDAFTKNYYLFSGDPRSPGPFFTVNWDADATFGLNWDGNLAKPPALGPWGRSTGLSSKLAALPVYRDQYLDLLDALTETALEGGLLEARLAELEALLAPDIRFEECRWQRPGAFAQSIALIRDLL
jgi:spore coat protein H